MQTMSPIRNKKHIDMMKLYLRSKNVRNNLMFITGISSALRISDILKLHVYDLWDGKKPKQYVYLNEKKTGKAKKFPISLNFEKAIYEYMKEYQPNQEDFVFKSRKGDKAISRQQAELILSQAWDYLGFTEPFGTHSMRKTWAYWAWKSNFDLALIMEALNHSSIASTKKYIGILQEDLDGVYMALNL